MIWNIKPPDVYMLDNFYLAICAIHRKIQNSIYEIDEKNCNVFLWIVTQDQSWME